jgi:DNA ligase-associated metallophosphoesterase
MTPFSPKPLTNLWKRPHGLSKQHVIPLAGLNFVPDMSGALFLAEENLLLVADLHLEQGASLARRGLHVPPYDTAVTLSLLERVLVDTAAKRLVLLGDSFHDATAHAEVLPQDAERLKQITSRIDTIWIVGNHDPVTHDQLGGACVEELALGNITLRHIPSKLSEGEFEIAGHLHPGASLEQRGQHIRTKCFVGDDRRIILPAFGSYTGALNLRNAAFQGLFNPQKTKAWMISKTAIHAFPLNRLS